MHFFYFQKSLIFINIKGWKNFYDKIEKGG